MTIGQPVKIAVTLRVRGSAMIFVLHPGDQLWEYIAGGAGYGDPLERDPAAVLADVLDGKIASAEDYRVVLTADGGAVNEVKTKEWREGRGGQRIDEEKR